MEKKKPDPYEVALFKNRGPNNIAININKYIAKYDFDIAEKIKVPDRDYERSYDDFGMDFSQPSLQQYEESVKSKFRQNAILEIL